MVDELSRGEVKFTVDSIPEADMSNVPGGYRKTGPSYVWTGDGAADILATLLTGKGGYSIVIPPSGGTGEGVPEDKFLYGIVIAMAAVLVILIGVLFWKGRGGRSQNL
ncbi:hypothetical protein AKJ58_00935 [candidate division MSBL1 archaeon SCGC-AAA385D11]|uniref:Uncharacterized protein n=1 Tax=candidate division MSBL1 archaeon SCGC-AAA385D11 TaxID=1698286 RepID=A0A133VNV1_9EURY|nr:hypothetical protein AKJ58_00935 [candidate division MSBL1 archaeon SCGC-AAA385D11]